MTPTNHIAHQVAEFVLENETSRSSFSSRGSTDSEPSLSCNKRNSTLGKIQTFRARLENITTETERRQRQLCQLSALRLYERNLRLFALSKQDHRSRHEQNLIIRRIINRSFVALEQLNHKKGLLKARILFLMASAYDAFNNPIDQKMAIISFEECLKNLSEADWKKPRKICTEATKRLAKCVLARNAEAD